MKTISKKEPTKVLWIVSFPLPEVAHLAGVPKNAFGGWVGTMLHALSNIPEFEFHVAMKSPVSEIKIETIFNIHYYLIPQSKKDRFDIPQKDCDKILKIVSPDILHSEGTEGAFTLRFLKTWKGENSVSLQGILNAYEPYEYGNLPSLDMLLSLNLKKILLISVLWSNKHLFFRKRMKKEYQTIRLAKHIIGRTTWDKAHAYAINPSAKYYHCHHLLREPFHQKRWSINSKKDYSIFSGNAGTVRKGAHFLLEAVALLKNEYPHIKVYFAGEKPYRSSWKEWKKIIGYPAYIQYLIKKLDIEKHVEFLGMIQAEEMAEHMSKAHLFVLPSAIENSPTTLSEAMLMGVPSITSYVGGTPDMAKDGEEALFYRDNDPKYLAYQIKRIFDNDDLALKLSINARERALKDHNKQDNVDRMVNIYKSIFEKSTEQ